jgi:DNA-binding transcriptional ArsR family regulator
MAPHNDLLNIVRSEIEERLTALRPLLAEHEQLLAAVEALEAGEVSSSRKESRRASNERSPAPGSSARSARRPRAARRSASATVTRKLPAPGRPSARRGAGASSQGSKGPRGGRAQRGAAREAILAALEHGSHTVGELVMVTAMSAPNISGNVRRLLTEGRVSKTERAGKTAYVLSE